jgi:predicted ArsR family transcriptional regulator
MPSEGTTSTKESRGRRALLDLLKQEGPMDAGTLAGRLGVTDMAVRQHLTRLEEERMVTFEAEQRPLGRPAKLWRLTPAADRFFPDGHADLSRDLLEALRATFGAAGVDALIAHRGEIQAAAYVREVDASAPLEWRLEALAALRTQEGYMATVERQEDGGFLLLENHCPICAAARSCSGLCAAELSLFRRVLGDDVEVEREDHILAGARRCAYRVAEKPK